MPNVAMKHERDPRQVILDAIGDLSGFEIAQNEVLCATYLRPEKTHGGIVIPRSNLNEDLFQSKAHLVVKIGNACQFERVSQKTGRTLGLKIELHDWVVIRPSDALAMEVNGVHCRLVYDDQIRARIQNCEQVW
jgi:co-chaperonin GroES (HSP10)